MKTQIISGTFAIIVLMFTSCAKDGATGPAGPAGTNGTNGTNGNANVTGSNTVTLNNWTSEYDDGIEFVFSKTITWSGITQAIVDKGAVMVYAGDVGEWVALPYAETGSDFSTTFVFVFTTGTVTIYAMGYDDSGSPSPSDFDGTVVRIVAIAASNRAANPDVNLNDYNAVKKAFKLKD